MQYARAWIFTQAGNVTVFPLILNYSKNGSNGYYSLPPPIPQGKADTLYGFEIDYPANLGKASASQGTAVVGDTIVSRLIFNAASNRGLDTLILVGIWRNTTGIFSFSPNKLLSRVGFFDLKGRVQKSSLPSFSFFNVPLLQSTK